VSARSEPTGVIAASGKLRNGLYLRRVALYADRVSFEVFASRPLAWEDLSSLRLDDDVGTEYRLAEPEGGAIEGPADIEFTPAVPAGWSRLHLRQPGRGLHIVNKPWPSS
jgi:hypothetical protein